MTTAQSKGTNGDVDALTFCPNMLCIDYPRNRFFTKPSCKSFHCAILIVDIPGFSSFATEMCRSGSKGLEKLHFDTTDYLEEVIGRIYDFGGDVIHFADSALISIFTHQLANGDQDRQPYTIEDSILAALRCAWEVRGYEVGELGGYFGVSHGTVTISNLGGIDEQSLLVSTGQCIIDLRLLKMCVEVGDKGDVLCSVDSFGLANNSSKTTRILGEENDALGAVKILEFEYAECDENNSSVYAQHSRSYSSFMFEQFVNLKPMRRSRYRSAIDANELLRRRAILPPQNVNNSKLSLDHQSAETDETSKEDHLFASSQRCEVLSQMISDAKSFVPTPALAALRLGSPELRKVTTMFLSLDSYDQDIHSDPLSLQPFVLLLQEVLKETGGFLRQFLVDDKGCVAIAMWGVPSFTHANDCSRGLYCAFSMSKRVAEIGHRCSIGLTTGYAYCGIIGSEIRRDYAVFGDSVTVAARLMSKASTVTSRVLIHPSILFEMSHSEKVHLVDCGYTYRLKGMPMPISPLTFSENIDDSQLEQKACDLDIDRNLVVHCSVYEQVVAFLSYFTAVAENDDEEDDEMESIILVGKTFQDRSKDFASLFTQSNPSFLVHRLIEGEEEESPKLGSSKRNSSKLGSSKRNSSKFGSSKRESSRLGSSRKMASKKQSRKQSSSSLSNDAAATTSGSIESTTSDRVIIHVADRVARLCFGRDDISLPTLVLTGSYGEVLRLVQRTYIQKAIVCLHVQCCIEDEPNRMSVIRRIFWEIYDAVAQKQPSASMSKNRTSISSISSTFLDKREKQLYDLLAEVEQVVDRPTSEEVVDKVAAALLVNPSARVVEEAVDGSLITLNALSLNALILAMLEFMMRSHHKFIVVIERAQHVDMESWASLQYIQKYGGLKLALGFFIALPSLTLTSHTNPSHIRRRSDTNYAESSPGGDSLAGSGALFSELSDECRLWEYFTSLGSAEAEYATTLPRDAPRGTATSTPPAANLGGWGYLIERGITDVRDGAEGWAGETTLKCRSFYKILDDSNTQIVDTSHLTEGEIEETLSVMLSLEDMPNNMASKVFEITSGHVYWVRSIVHYILRYGLQDFLTTLDTDIGTIIPSQASGGVCDRNQSSVEAPVEAAPGAGLGHSSAGFRVILRMRLGRLPAEQCTLLKFASVVGNEFSISMLESLLSDDRVILRHTVSLLVEAGFLCYVEDSPMVILAFCKKLIREVVYSSIPTSEASTIHLRIAEYLQTTYVDNLTPFFSNLSYHYSRHASSAALAIRYGSMAAAQAIDDGNYFRALSLISSCAKTPNLAVSDRHILAFAAEKAIGQLRDSEAASSGNVIAGYARRSGAKDRRDAGGVGNTTSIPLSARSRALMNSARDGDHHTSSAAESSALIRAYRKLYHDLSLINSPKTQAVGAPIARWIAEQELSFDPAASESTRTTDTRIGSSVKTNLPAFANKSKNTTKTSEQGAKSPKRNLDSVSSVNESSLPPASSSFHTPPPIVPNLDNLAAPERGLKPSKSYTQEQKEQIDLTKPSLPARLLSCCFGFVFLKGSGMRIYSVDST